MTLPLVYDVTGLADAAFALVVAKLRTIAETVTVTAAPLRSSLDLVLNIPPRLGVRAKEVRYSQYRTSPRWHPCTCAPQVSRPIR